ncbi:LacI family DNA-binding transcriptional regulator [Demequina sp. SYSU T00039]|uniref:LacI family DNA-binding transcriptional regulator n=1 Tax=Demequina lignilytica TaxID=3051663 RepID=A0AAW7M8W1_9MICO|nr:MULTISPECIES: LacI family DNA-binding transcriptional regulator [unclassified Demequina]MDN4477857.1 LacI family DNA-binding transcriptional regulator [Demequina sp. SYSU T00039-1]MDN4487766.1 LacI family DNA-binding transcriptional regulator [Demequina sp. SYSU T00039]MDN4490851.1 LacI family DNA-binding transcriptional regulator [Demequina sp. SYSU T00068]
METGVTSDSPSKAARATTLSDVAAAAGVSMATASKALNGKRGVNPSTRARVEQAAQDLGFYPNQQARSLMFGRSGSIGLLTTDLEGRFSLPILAGVESALRDGEAVAIMANASGSAEMVDRHVHALLSRRVDGIIYVARGTEPVLPLPDSIKVPVVYAYGPSTDADDVSIVADHRGCGRLAVDHLIDVGCRAIAHIGGPDDPATIGYMAARLRARGTLDGLAARGMDPVLNRPLFGDWTEAWGWEAVEQLLARDVEFDGLVCANDQIARGAIDCLAARGMRVPTDVAVIGFDNWAPVAQTARLPQSSVDMNLDELGRVAARAVLDPDGFPQGSTRVAGRIVARESTAHASLSTP